MTNSTEAQREELLSTFMGDRPLTHQMLFPHRHKDTSPDFHKDIVSLLNSASPLVVLMAFRGAAKSTLIEEYVLTSVLFKDARFVLIVGSNWESACQRLAAIRQEIETNEVIMELFGDQKASPWSVDEIVLACGAKIKAIGAGQSMRGVKHNEDRPDLAVIDDLEDEQNVHTEEARRKIDRWLSGTLRPALHPTEGRIRFIGTPLHPKALIQRKFEDPEWTSLKFPLLVIDTETGEEKSAWPSRFPLATIKKLQAEYVNNGNLIEFTQEYMCRAEDVSGKPFKPEMIKPSTPTAGREAVYIFCDPARTVKSTSARTGYVAFSWRGNKLKIHDALGAFHRPDEIIKTLMDWDEKFSPVKIGVELNGLEEFIQQPLLAAQVAAGRSIPYVGYHAPRDKMQFILGLQPFYASGDVTHAKSLPDLEQELLQFPTGRNDVINALAYALVMRAGRPVYGDFTDEHVEDNLSPHAKSPRYLIISSRPAMTAVSLVQYIDGTMRVYRDWVKNAPPQECLERIYQEARMMSAGEIKFFSPANQFDQYTNNGLPAAIKRLNISVQKTPATTRTEGLLAKYMITKIQGVPGLLVSSDARWVVNGLSGGYSRKLEKGGVLSDQPTDDQYRLVIEGLESLAAFLDNSASAGDTERRYAITSTGRKYLSSLPTR